MKIDRDFSFLYRNHKASALEQFRLTLSWNRPDIAQTCLHMKRSELTQAQLDVCMFEALVDNRVEYVKLLIENGVSIKNFLTFNRLQALYNACGSNSTLHLIAKDVIRGANHHHSPTRVYSLYDIGLIIEKLIGQGYRSSYTRRIIRHLCARQTVSERQNFNVCTDAEQKEQHSQNTNSNANIVSSDEAKKNSISDDPKFDFPYNELLVFAVLTKRHEMALFFWAHGEEALAKALIGCRLNKSLAREAQDDELDTDIADEFLTSAEDFQQRKWLSDWRTSGTSCLFRSGGTSRSVLSGRWRQCHSNSHVWTGELVELDVSRSVGHGVSSRFRRP